MTNEQIQSLPTETLLSLVRSTTPKTYGREVDAASAELLRRQARTDSRDPHPTRTGIFRLHNCWKCKTGEKPCVSGNPSQCDYPRARND